MENEMEHGMMQGLGRYTIKQTFTTLFMNAPNSVPTYSIYRYIYIYTHMPGLESCKERVFEYKTRWLTGTSLLEKRAAHNSNQVLRPAGTAQLLEILMQLGRLE